MGEYFRRGSIEGTIVGIDRGRYRTVSADNQLFTCVAGGVFRQDPLVIGDEVLIEGQEDLRRITERRKRRNIFSRSNEKGRVKLIAANVDQLLIVTAAADPKPRTGLIDRFLIAAEASKMTALLCITKTDLADPGPLAACYPELPVTFASPDKPPELTALLAGKKTVAIGHSGVGKSTLINHLCPEANRAVAQVNAVTGKGRHTSSSSELFALGEDLRSGIIDTPGVRSFGIRHLGKAVILETVQKLFPAAQDCLGWCEHTGEPKCRLFEGLPPERLTKLQRTLREAFSQASYNPRGY